MVQNGAKYNKGLKRWELPPGSNPTARMGVQGGEGQDSIPPLGQKKAALMKDAERKRKNEDDRNRTIADSISKKASDAAQKAKKEYLDANPAFDPEKDFKQNSLTLKEQQAIWNMARGKKAQEAAESAAQRAREQEAEKLPEKDRWLSGAKKYQWKFSAPVQEPKSVKQEGVSTKASKTAPAEKKTKREKTPRKAKKLPSLSQISDFDPNNDRIVVRNGRTFIESDTYAPIEIQPLRTR